MPSATPTPINQAQQRCDALLQAIEARDAFGKVAPETRNAVKDVINQWKGTDRIEALQAIVDATAPLERVAHRRATLSLLALLGSAGSQKALREPHLGISLLDTLADIARRPIRQATNPDTNGRLVSDLMYDLVHPDRLRGCAASFRSALPVYALLVRDLAIAGCWQRTADASALPLQLPPSTELARSGSWSQDIVNHSVVKATERLLATAGTQYPTAAGTTLNKSDLLGRPRPAAGDTTIATGALEKVITTVLERAQHIPLSVDTQVPTTGGKAALTSEMLAGLLLRLPNDRGLALPVVLRVTPGGQECIPAILTRVSATRDAITFQALEVNDGPRVTPKRSAIQGTAGELAQHIVAVSVPPEMRADFPTPAPVEAGPVQPLRSSNFSRRAGVLAAVGVTVGLFTGVSALGRWGNFGSTVSNSASTGASWVSNKASAAWGWVGDKLGFGGSATVAAVPAHTGPWKATDLRDQFLFRARLQTWLPTGMGEILVEAAIHPVPSALEQRFRQVVAQDGKLDVTTAPGPQGLAALEDAIFRSAIVSLPYAGLEAPERVVAALNERLKDCGLAGCYQLPAATNIVALYAAKK